MTKPTLAIKTLPKLKPLLLPARYKAAHGGRGGAKSHFFAELLIFQCYTRDSLRVVCIREVQYSLKDSVHQLICDKIAKFSGCPAWGLQRSLPLPSPA